MASTNTQLAEVLKNLRETKGLTLRRVEKVTGISNAYLSQLENGKTQNPSANVLYKLAEAYGVEFNALLELAGIIGKKQKTKKESASSSSFALYANDLTPEEEKELLNYLKYIRHNKNAG